ncbi:MAG: VWA domain-containing protein [Bacteroidetes bacterium]|nr:VWA domain-containing protein [Bacteroidota bacterium]
MLDFEHDHWLYLLFGLIPLLLLFGATAWWRKRAIGQFADPRMAGALLKDHSSTRKGLRFILVLLAMASLILALANLRMGAKKQTVKREGADIMLAVDLSRSMLAEDLRPNRLDRSKFFIAQLLRELRNDKVGLVVFAGNAYLQMPLTVDSRAALMYLNILDTEVIPRQGTAIGEAIALATEAFEQGQGPAGKTKNRALIIVTDGENNEGDAVELARKASESGIAVFTVGVGTVKGAPIPMASRSGIVDFKRDQAGNIVLTKLNETMLQEIAAAGNGKYYHISGGTQTIKDIATALDQLDKQTGESFEYTDYRKHFPVFLSIALVLLVFEFLLTDRAAAWWKKLNLLNA